MRVLPMGRRAVLVDELDDPAAWAATLRSLAIPGVIEVVPAARTVLVECDDIQTTYVVRRRAVSVSPDPTIARSTQSVIEIEVRYDGADLHSVAAGSGLGVDELIAVHSGTTYRVAFCGFSPGFAYLDGTDRRLHLPRRDSPRPSVPAGSVAVAAGYTAIYPRATPGGWHLLGTTSASLFDPARTPPALLEPGARVRLVPV